MISTNQIYDRRRLLTVLFFVAAAVVAALFVYISNVLVKELSQQERERMQIWADATRQLSTMSLDDGSADYTEFLFGIIQSNHNIPVILCDDHDNILMHRNFRLPEPIDSTQEFAPLSRANEEWLRAKVEHLRNTPNVITIHIDPTTSQRIYYEDSTILKRLAYYPYIQLIVMLVFILVVYFAVISMKKAEQNKVWVGLSKETAHQLGTPISSLMAWVEMLRLSGADEETVADMDKDVHRLSIIADRFSKIGSVPELEPAELNAAVDASLGYMKSRISNRVVLTIHPSPEAIDVKLCQSLFEWVMENLTKNAVDAMLGEGRIDVTIATEHADTAIIDITDTGKGIARKNFKNVFNPGYTTKKRGWGLGLTLVKRIVETYHRGRIYVKDSEIDHGTTFRIELPIAK